MSLHKLTAGSGYDYLTRQVAALDATDKGRTGLASYYTERGESPGVWVGSGMEGIDGLDVGDPVTAEQMRALFGCGLHPLAELRLQQLERRDLTGQDFQDVMRLGAPFKIIDEATPFQVEVAKRIAALDGAIGEPVDVSVAAGVGTHPSTALVGGIAVWRAANGINPQDPRPTGGTQLESLPALWKQRLDRDVAWATYPAADATADERQAGRTALSRSYSDRQHPYQQPERRPSGPSAPRR
jgi:TrwC relaxase